MTSYVRVLTLLVALLALAPAAPAQDDEHAQRTLRAQETSQQMAALADRSWVMLQDLGRRRLQLQDDQFRTQYRHLWQLSENLHEMARHAEGTLALYCLLHQDQQRSGSLSETMEEMDQLLRHLQTVADDLEASFQTVEQIAERYYALTASDTPAGQ